MLFALCEFDICNAVFFFGEDGRHRVAFGCNASRVTLAARPANMWRCRWRMRALHWAAASCILFGGGIDSFA